MYISETLHKRSISDRRGICRVEFVYYSPVEMQDTGKTYHTTCTGLALETAKAHAEPADITLFGSCFCPFVHRVWIALEYLGIPYQVKKK